MIKLDIMLRNLSLAQVRGNTITQTIKESRRNLPFFDLGLWDEADECEQGLVELGLTTHDVKDLVHVLLELLQP